MPLLCVFFDQVATVNVVEISMFLNQIEPCDTMTARGMERELELEVLLCVTTFGAPLLCTFTKLEWCIKIMPHVGVFV